MSIEIAAVSATMGPSAGAGAAATAPAVHSGPGVSLTDVGRFEQAMGGAQARAAQGPSKAAQALMQPFEHINREASSIAAQARQAQAAGRDLSPGEMVMLTVRCQEFSFHAQLLSNMANRMSDGVQQLFRQQS